MKLGVSKAYDTKSNGLFFEKKLEAETLGLIRTEENLSTIFSNHYHEKAHVKLAELLRQRVVEARVMPGLVVTESEKMSWKLSVFHELVAVFAPVYYFREKSRIGEEYRKKVSFRAVLSRYKSFHWMLLDILLRDND